VVYWILGMALLQQRSSMVFVLIFIAPQNNQRKRRNLMATPF
jgi:hypothetical protein